jgi:hypothetical protein
MRREDETPIRPWFKPEENTEDAAKALLARKLVELDENRLPVPTSDTVAGWIEQFLAHHDVEPSTLSGSAGAAPADRASDDRHRRNQVAEPDCGAPGPLLPRPEG